MHPIFADILPYLFTNDEIIGSGKFCNLLADPVGRVYAVCMTFTIALAFAGLIMAAYKVSMGGDLSALGTQLVMTVLVAVVVNHNNLPRWFLDAEVAMADGLPASMGFKVENFMTDFTLELVLCTLDSLPGMIATMVVAGFLGLGIGFIALAIVSALMMALAWIMCALCWLGVVIAYMVQIAIVYIGLSIAPIFLGMLLFEKTRDTGIKYFMGMIGVLFWPLGWDLGFLILDALISPINDMFFASPIAIGLQAVNFILGGVLAAALGLFLAGMVWALLTKAPKIISEAITSGANIGAGLISAAAGGGAGAVSAGASAGAGVTMMAASAGAGFAGKGASAFQIGKKE